MLVISFVLAIPVSLYAINRWLEGYAYRVSVTFTTFLIAGSAIAIIAFSMLIFQGIKAAKSKPADVLQSD